MIKCADRYIYILVFFFSFSLNYLAASEQKLQDSDYINLINRYRMAITSKENGPAKYDCALSKLNDNDKFRLILDKERLGNATEKQIDSIKKESGYTNGMFNGFEYIKSNLISPISINDLVKIQEIVVKGVIKSGQKEKRKRIIPGVSDGSQYFEFKNEGGGGLAEDLTTGGEVTTSDYIENFENIYKSEFNCSSSEPALWNYIRDPIRIMSNVRAITRWHLQYVKEEKPYDDDFGGQTYEYDLDEAQRPIIEALEYRFAGEIEKLKMASNIFASVQSPVKEKDMMTFFKAVGEFVRNVHMSHIFEDANQRTVAILLLDKILISNGFPPAILDNNKIFGGNLNIDEISKAIKKGIFNYLDLVHSNDTNNLEFFCP